MSFVKDADLAVIRLRSDAWLDRSSNKSQDQLGLLGSGFVLRLLKRWSAGAHGGGMESVQLTAAAAKLSARGAANDKKLLLTQRALYILQAGGRASARATARARARAPSPSRTLTLTSHTLRPGLDVPAAALAQEAGHGVARAARRGEG